MTKKTKKKVATVGIIGALAALLLAKPLGERFFGGM